MTNAKTILGKPIRLLVTQGNYKREPSTVSSTLSSKDEGVVRNLPVCCIL